MTSQQQHTRPNTIPSTRKTLVLSALIGLWLAATLGGLWWFQQQNVRPFVSAQDDARFWQASQVELLLQPLTGSLPVAADNQVTLLHFWNPDCLCNQISQRHFDSLITGFSAAQLRIIVVAPASTTDDQMNRFRKLNGSRMSVMRAPADFPLPVSPGLALFAPNGQLGYFGAYGFGALCSVANDDFFPNIVRSLQQQGYGPFVNVAGSGCFCPWPTSDNDSNHENTE